MTTPSAGAVERDATNFYGTTDAGNRGIIPIRHFIRADATRTFTSNTNSQAIFTSPANGRLTLETGTYRVRGVLACTAMSATSGNRSINLVGAGTATIAAASWYGNGFDGGTGATSTTGASWATAARPPRQCRHRRNRHRTHRQHRRVVRSIRGRDTDSFDHDGDCRRLGPFHRVVHGVWRIGQRRSYLSASGIRSCSAKGRSLT